MLSRSPRSSRCNAGRRVGAFARSDAADPWCEWRRRFPPATGCERCMAGPREQFVEHHAQASRRRSRWRRGALELLGAGVLRGERRAPVGPRRRSRRHRAAATWRCRNRAAWRAVARSRGCWPVLRSRCDDQLLVRVADGVADFEEQPQALLDVAGGVASAYRSMGVPSMYSITKYGRPSSVVPPSSRRAMFGCVQ